MRLEHLPAVLDPARFEGPEQDPAVERLEGARVGNLIRDVREFAWPRPIQCRARLSSVRLENSEWRARSVGASAERAEVELLQFVHRPAGVDDRAPCSLDIGDG